MIHRDNEAQGKTNRRIAMFNGKRLSGWMALAVFATVGGAMVAADPAFAKVDVDKLTIGGEARVRYEVRTGTTFGGTQANESAADHRIRLNVGYDLTPDVSFFAQIQDARVWGGEAGQGGQVNTGIGAVSGANTNGTGVDLHQGYLELRNVLIPGLSLKAGRQEIMYGDQRLFGNFNWSMIGNTFDAVKMTHSSALADLDLFWARIIDNSQAAGTNTATTANSGAPLFPAAGQKSTTNQDIYGAYLTLKPARNWTIEPYYFLLADARKNATTTSFAPQASDQTRHTFGGRINGKAGGLDTTLEAAGQKGAMGDGQAAGYQDHALKINAHAEAAKIGYTFDAVPMKPRIGFEFDYASGDNCVNGAATQGCGGLVGSGTHMNTFDNLYPTNHGLYGGMDLQAWKNSVNYQANFTVKPSPVSKLEFKYIVHRLARTTDNWYRAGQTAYATTLSSNQEASLGQEFGVNYWHTFKEKFKFETGFGHFFAGAFLDKAAAVNITGAPNSTSTFVGTADQNWGYVMGSVLF